MTYDELLLNINWIIGVHKELPPSVNDSLKALRAVVELHKPYGIDRYPGLQSYCVHCEHLESQIWPCPTAQAIEKALQGTTHLVEPKPFTTDETGTDV